MPTLQEILSSSRGRDEEIVPTPISAPPGQEELPASVSAPTGQEEPPAFDVGPTGQLHKPITLTDILQSQGGGQPYAEFEGSLGIAPVSRTPQFAEVADEKARAAERTIPTFEQMQEATEETRPARREGTQPEISTLPTKPPEAQRQEIDEANKALLSVPSESEYRAKIEEGSGKLVRDLLPFLFKSERERAGAKRPDEMAEFGIGLEVVAAVWPNPKTILNIVQKGMVKRLGMVGAAEALDIPPSKLHELLRAPRKPLTTLGAASQSLEKIYKEKVGEKVYKFLGDYIQENVPESVLRRLSTRAGRSPEHLKRRTASLIYKGTVQEKARNWFKGLLKSGISDAESERIKQMMKSGMRPATGKAGVIGAAKGRRLAPGGPRGGERQEELWGLAKEGRKIFDDLLEDMKVRADDNAIAELEREFNIGIKKGRWYHEKPTRKQVADTTSEAHDLRSQIIAWEQHPDLVRKSGSDITRGFKGEPTTQGLMEELLSDKVRRAGFDDVDDALKAMSDRRWKADAQANLDENARVLLQNLQGRFPGDSKRKVRDLYKQYDEKLTDLRRMSGHEITEDYFPREYGSRYMKVPAPQKLGIVSGYKPGRLRAPFLKRRRGPLSDEMIRDIIPGAEIAYTTMIREGNFVANKTLLDQIGRSAEALTEKQWLRLPHLAQKRFRKMADDKKAWGEAAGKYIPKGIWDDINNIQKVDSDTQRLIKSVWAAWKAGRTAYNPPTQMVNIVGNAVLDYIEPRYGARLKDMLPIYSRGFKEMAQEATSQYRGEAIEQGLLNTGYMGAEFEHVVKPFINPTETTWAAHVSDSIMKVFEHPELGAPARFFGFVENSFKLAKYIELRSHHNMNPVKAAEVAQQTFFNYRDVPNWLRWARTNPASPTNPFLTFTYKATGGVGRSAVINPIKGAKLYMFYKGIEEVNKDRLGLDDDEYVALKSAFNYKYGRSSWEFAPAILLGGTAGMEDYTQLSTAKYLPLQNVVDKGPLGIPGLGSISFNPLYQIAAGVLTGRKSYPPRAGGEIVGAGENPVAGWAKFLASQLSIPLLGGSASQRLARSWQEKPEFLSDQPQAFSEALAASVLGVRIEKISPEQLTAKMGMEVRSREKDISRVGFQLATGNISEEEFEKRLDRILRSLDHTLRIADKAAVPE